LSEVSGIYALSTEKTKIVVTSVLVGEQGVTMNDFVEKLKKNRNLG
jgi:hypothetical protein